MHQTARSENEVVHSTGISAGFGIYACPNCKGKLMVTNHTLHCHICQRTYEVRGQIPDFILEDLNRSTHPVLRKFIDWLAPIYETKLWYPVVLNLATGIGRASLPQLVTVVQGIVGSVTGSVLDVACGPGTFGRRVATPSKRVYGIDISEGMLRRGLTYAQREHVTNIYFARAKVEALPFGNGAFDAGICCGSLHLFADTIFALREIGRALKPGAPLAGITFTAGNAGILRFHKRLWRSHGLRVFEIRELEQYLREAGFDNYQPRASGSLLAFGAQKCRV